ncbi:MAG TPA: M90 family metallopeptidase [Steroidobacteraceae bacterium]|nr:M90 family metallopeptidase [Steroidobacteraceae bacterium]
MTAAIILALAAVVIAVLLGRPLWQAHQQRQLRARPLPAAWREHFERELPFYRAMPADLRARLDGLVQQFVAEKEFVGCRGLEVSLEMKLTIAAQACLLVVNRAARLYDELHSVLVYPAAFIAPHEHHDEAGVVHRHDRVLSGETWDTHRVILSWDDVQASAAERGSGFNVVYHEFAHYLDAEDGHVNGAPLLGESVHYERWSKVMKEEFEKLQDAAARNQPTLIDPYGAEDPGEFFAVVTETFFELPAELREQHAALYDEFRRYYRLDPASWARGAAP